MSKTFDQLPTVAPLAGTESFPVNQTSQTKRATINDVTVYLSTALSSVFASTSHNHDSLYQPLNSNIQEHIASSSNPHSTTKSQVGLGNVTNDEQVKRSEMGQANGVATLDTGGKVPANQLPSTLMNYKGVWNATANVPSLADGTGQAGDVYRVTVAGTQFTPPISFEVGDYCVYNGTTWEKSDTTDSVPSVFGRTGPITAQTNDYSWAQVNKTTSSIQDITSRSHSLLSDIGTNTHAQIDTALTKLGTIQEGAEVNVSPDWDSTSGDSQILNKPLLNQDAGTASEPQFTDNLNGSCTVGIGAYNLYPSSDYTGQIKQYIISGSTFTLTDNVMNYIVADYNGGTPIVRNTVNLSDINDSSVIPIFSVFRVGNNLHNIDWDSLGKGLPNKLNRRERVLRRFEIESGLTLSEAATRLVKTLAGTVWYGGLSLSLSSASSDTDHTHVWYHSSGAWTFTPTTQYDNNNYDNGTNLTALTANRYAVNWVFRGVYQGVNATNIVIGRGDYTLAQAIAAPIPSLPSFVSTTCVLVGRIIVQKGATAATQIDQIQTVTLTQAQATSHDDLLGRDSASQHPATSISNTPSGSISSTTVQAALNELDSEKQPVDATLTALAGVVTASDSLIYATGVDTFSTTTLTSTARTLLDDASVSDMRTTLGVPSLTGDNSFTGQIIGGFGAKVTTGTLDWNDVTNARSGNGVNLLLGSASNGPGGASYYHPFSFEYSSKDGSGNMTQFAIPYGNAGQFPMYLRTRFQSTWSSWRAFVMENVNGRVTIGTTTDDGVNKLQVNGTISGTSFNSITGLSSTSPSMDGVAAVGTGVTVARADHVHPSDTTKANTSGKLSQFAATTSAELAGVISDETGSGALVFATSPTLTTPNIGVATGTSFNSITGLSDATPSMNGVAASGTGVTVARADHVHPSDTSKASLTGAAFTGFVTTVTTTTLGTSTNAQNIFSSADILVPTGTTNSGTVNANNCIILRNSTAADSDDGGTTTTLAGLQVTSGHHNVNTSATPVTTNLIGIKVTPYLYTGTVTNYYGLWLANPGGSVVPGTNNWGVYQESAAARNYFAGTVNIGSSTATEYKLYSYVALTDSNVFASRFGTQLTMTASATKNQVAVYAEAMSTNIATSITNSGYVAAVLARGYLSNASNAGTLTDQYGMWASAGINSCAVGTVITNSYAIRATTFASDADGTITNAYGVYVETSGTSSTVTNKWGVYQITSTYRNYFAGNSLFGTTTENTTTGNAKVQSSNGVYLGNSANSAANVLDWYEEGTFTPTSIGETSAGTGTYTIQVGRYTRVGNRVHFTLTLGWSAHTGTGNLAVAGLPFTSNSTTNSSSALAVSHDGLVVASGKCLTATVTVNATGIKLFAADPAGGAIAQVAIDTAVTSLTLSGTYEV